MSVRPDDIVYVLMEYDVDEGAVIRDIYALRADADLEKRNYERNWDGQDRQWEVIPRRVS